MSADAAGMMPGMIEIRQLQYSELTALPGFAEMFAAHVAACHVPEFGTPEENVRAWTAMEDMNLLRAFAALDGEELVGYLFGARTAGMHYAGCRRFDVDSLYVSPARRGQGIGTRLLDAARDEARLSGCIAMCLSAPADSVAEQAYSRRARRLGASFVLSI